MLTYTILLDFNWLSFMCN